MILRWRRAFQVLFAVGLSYLFLRQDYVQAAQPWFTRLNWLDPLAGLAATIRGQWPLLLLVSMVSLAIAFFWGRLFCGWFCPVGTLLDLLGDGCRLVGLRGRRWPAATGRVFGYLRWFALAFVIVMILAGDSWALALNPFSIWPREIGRVSSALFPWTLGALILLGLAVFPRFWCRYLCPTGSLLSLVSRGRRRAAPADGTCQQCGLCRRECPMENIGTDLRFGADCLSCGHCQRVCREKGAALAKRKAPAVDRARREFLIAGGAGALAAAAVLTGARSLARGADASGGSRLLRPPGAQSEIELAAACNRCGQCLAVCPTRCLVAGGLEAGLPGLGLPRFVPRRGKCMRCMACGQVCPTGALVPIDPGAVRLGTAVLDRRTCLSWAKGVDCLLCVEVCPAFAISLDAQRRPLLDQKKCIGCGACEFSCPVAGSAIIVTSRGEQRRL